MSQVIATFLEMDLAGSSKGPTNDPNAKTCRDCGQAKPLEAFPLQKGGRLGRHPLCKPCRASQERARYRRQRTSILQAMREDAGRSSRVRWRALERKYGLSRAAFEARFVWQRGLCAICQLRCSALVVDHDHRSGAVRGLLCPTCNLALGQLEDEAARLDRAAAYLEAER